MQPFYFSKPIHYHGKGFSLNWDIPSAWMVLVHFRNAESKPWYRSTERSYRFRRWFLRKGKDRFSNIANFQQPFVTVWVFRGISPIPFRIRVPMEVTVLRINEPEAVPLAPGLPFSPACHDSIPRTRIFVPNDLKRNERLVFSGLSLKAPMLNQHLPPRNILAGIESSYHHFRKTYYQQQTLAQEHGNHRETN